MEKTKIEWCDSTWNPITGCLHGCEYCYARGIAKRFEGVWDGDRNVKLAHTSVYPERREVYGIEFDGLGIKYRVGNDKNGSPKLISAPYPYGFKPTLRWNRLESGLERFKKPRNIFVGSMADMFGYWVPDRWIREVIEVCEAFPQHRYLFLTKNPKRYDDIVRNMTFKIDAWFGASAANKKDVDRITNTLKNLNRAFGEKTFLSLEPIHEDTVHEINWNGVDWIIIGAETGNRKGKIIPERQWIADMAEFAREREVPVFMKDSLTKIWGEPLIREYPWEV